MAELLGLASARKGLERKSFFVSKKIGAESPFLCALLILSNEVMGA